MPRDLSQRRLERKTARDLEAIAGRARCPRPDKHAYTTKAEAKRALRDHRGRAREGLHAYRCTCGLFHLGRLRPGRKSSDSRPGFHSVKQRPSGDHHGHDL